MTKMSSKVKRKVTVENSKESGEQPRRPSVFERLGPGALNLPSQAQDRHGRVDHNEKCRNWLRTGNCTYGNTCRYQHNPYTVAPKRVVKGEKEVDEKDLRYKVRKQRDEPKESRTGSTSPKRKGNKRSGSRSRKGEHESKIKSTVVVTRPRSPPAATGPTEPTEKEKKKAEGSWEEDSDDWPMDAAQLDYKEELTLERKRQQLQRELELELQKERMMNENVSFSESSSTSSSSDSGSISSSSDSSSSSSDDDSDSSSSSSTSSSSASQAPPKKKYKKPVSKKESHVSKSTEVVHKKALDDYDKIKSSRAAKSSSTRIHSPVTHDVSEKKGRDRKNISPLPAVSPKPRSTHDSGAKSSSHHVRKGPRTPSPPPPSRKQRQWCQSSSADSRSDARRNRGKRHKKKKDAARNDRYKTDYVPTPPRLSSPNRTALQPHGQLGKKAWQRDDLSSKSHHRNKDHSPLLLPRLSAPSTNSSLDRHVGSSFYSDVDKPQDKHNKSKSHGRKTEENFSKKGNNRDNSSKRSRLSPVKAPRHDSISPHYERYEADQSNKKMYSSPFLPVEKDEKNRRRSSSPVRRGKDNNKDRKKSAAETEKRRDNREVSPRTHENRKDNHYRGSDVQNYNKKEEPRVKRLLSPDLKKGRDNKIKDRGPKERAVEQDSWNEDHKKSLRIPEPRNRLDPPISQSSSSSSRNDRSRDRERDRKKGKDREPPPPLRDELERDRPRLTPPLRGAPDIHPHHALRDEPPVPVPRSHIYETDLPPDEREYAYGYGPHHEPAYIDDRVLPPEYDSDLLQVPPLYPPPDSADYPPVVYSDTRYRRDVALKDPPHMERIVGYGGREVSPLDPREPVVLPVREEDYLADLPIDERRAYDERWGRNRPLRDEWDPYSPLPPAALPPHVAASLDEDRYGMPRRRRASPDWHVRRGNERDLTLREPRSRSPQHRRIDDAPVPRPPWREPNDRHGNRINDNRSESQQKNQDDRKGRIGRRDRRDRSKRPDEHPSEPSAKLPQPPTKEKPNLKRSHSATPPRKDIKKRKEDTSLKEDTVVSEKSCSSRKSRDEPKIETKSSTTTKSSSKSVGKTKSLSPKPDEKQPSDKSSSVKASDKSDPVKTVSKSSSKHDGDEKRRRNNEGKSQVDDEFSDWSDGDDDLLNRDVVDSESNNGERPRTRTDDHRKEKPSTELSDATKDGKERSGKQKRDGSRDSRIRTHELRSESHSRTGSKERTSTESSRKQDILVPSAKESDSSEAFVVKDEAVEDLEDFMMTESVDYDPISDGELEALIEEPDDSLTKPSEANEDSKIVDALDVNWSALVSDPKPKFIPGHARKRFKAVHVLSRIGFSQAFAGAELSEKIMKFCQQQLDEEKGEEAEETADEKSPTEKFKMEHPIASFHVLLAQQKKERQNAFNNVGPNRRALCARQDLQIRKLLCRPSNKLLMLGPSSCVQQYGSADSEQELKKIDCQPPVINAPC